MTSTSTMQSHPTRRALRHTLLALAAATAVAACGGGGGSTGSGGTGALRLALTDAPACGYDNVFVTVERVRVHQSGSAGDNDGGWSDIVLSTPRRIDLLNLTNGVLEELGQTTLPAGRYSQIRLVLADNQGNGTPANAVKLTGGATEPLTTPSGQSSGLKLQANFDVQPNTTTDLVLDFDACRSIVATGSGKYNLKPVIQVLARTANGIQGYVAAPVATSGATVTAQQNGTVIRSTVADATGLFKLTFLPEGSYDLVVAAPNFSTAVVTSVPVTATTTVVNGTATVINPPASPMAGASGAVNAIEAFVRALQTLTGGPTVEVGFVPVTPAAGANPTTSTYSIRLPQNGPVRAPYAAGGTLSFAAPDTAAAGSYRLEAVASGRTTVTATTSVAGGGTQTVNFNFAP